MPEKRLDQALRIRNTALRNRICVPPMVCFGWSGEDGLPGERHVRHYRAMAEGGAGLIIQEATCVTREGRLHESQLGLWEDAQIEPARGIVEAVHAAGCPIFVQIHHAGVVGIAEDALCPDAYPLRRRGLPDKLGRRMSLAEIASIQEAFVAASVRAWRAGYDGVELHGCHRYLICQFLNARVNGREDVYGQEPERFVTEIVDGIRARTDENFAVGIRMGAFEPTLADGLRHAARFAAHGLDFLDVSYGFSGEDEPFAPAGSPVKDVIWAAGEIKRRCPDTQVFAVNGIRTATEARLALSATGVDVIDVGRAVLADPAWPRKALADQAPNPCLDCRRCAWFTDPDKCPARA